uniref:Uncharacterized protein n=1 Tax=Cannabis sativa TaxID=3483 RepID=A0A803NIH0_CANSA
MRNLPSAFTGFTTLSVAADAIRVVWCINNIHVGETFIFFVTDGVLLNCCKVIFMAKEESKSNGRKKEERLKSIERSCCSGHYNYVMSRSDIQEVTYTPTVLLLAQKLLDQQWVTWEHLVAIEDHNWSEALRCYKRLQ